MDTIRFLNLCGLLLFVALNVASAEEGGQLNSPPSTPSKFSVHPLPSLVITADPMGPSLLQYGSPASVMEKQELLLRTESSLGQTVGLEPGVSSSFFGAGASRPIIRGSGGDRIRVLRNGVGTLDVSNTSEDHAVSVNPLAAERIEILRGPETMLFGNSAIGGVVNVTDSTIAEQSLEVPLTGALDIRSGTADKELTGALLLEGSKNRWNWHVSGFHQDTDDYEIPSDAESQRLQELEASEGEEHSEEESSGRLENSATRSRGFSLGSSYVGERGFFGGAVTAFRSDYGIPGHMHEEHSALEQAPDADHDSEHHAEEDGVRIEMKQLRADFRGAVQPRAGKVENLKYSAAFSNYEHKELEGGEVASRFENDALEARVDAVHQPIDRLEGVAGMQVEFSDFTATGDEAFLPSSETFSPSVFVFERLPVNDYYRFEFGGRVSYTKVNPTDIASESFAPLSASAGVVLMPLGTEDYTVGFTGAYVERAPSAAELFADGAHVARQIFELGNSGLDVESSRGVDLVFRKNTGFFTASTSVFYQQYGDYINLSATDRQEDGFQVFEYDAVRTRFWGYEVEGVLHLLTHKHHALDFGVQVDSVQAKNRDSDSALPRVPPLRSQVRLNYEGEFLSAGVEGVFVEAQDRVAEFEIPTDSYNLINADLSVRLPVQSVATLAFYVRGTNLTDEEARIHSSFIKDLAPLRGRSVLFGLRGTF